MSIIIGADMVSTKSNFDLFSKGDVYSLVGNELLSILNNAGYRIFNLEVPLANTETPIGKCGPALTAPEETINGYKALGVDCVTIANNHIMDQGDPGFQSTIQTLKENNIDYVGGGDNLTEATKAKIVDLNGKKIGIYACAEHEFSIAGGNTSGANPFDPLESLDHILNLKSACDYVIVLYHGGKEHYRYPSPNLQKTCRKMINKGANLVVCQHSHCIGCEEKYNQGTIVYGQGNFLFDYYTHECWHTGLLVEITDNFNINYIPICKNDNAVRLANEKDATKIMSDFYQRSEEILTDGAVEKKYTEFSQTMIDNYLLTLSGVKRGSLMFRIANRITKRKLTSWIINRKYNKQNLLTVLNCVECEAHRELLIRGIKTK